LFSNISHPSSFVGAPRLDRATPLQADEERTTATTRHCLMFTLTYCIDPASTTLLKTPWPTNFAVGFCCW